MTTDLRIVREPQPTDRFKLTNIPLVTPAKCACCGAVDRPVVDFDMTIQYYGAVLLCESCLANAARLIDMVPAIEVVAAKQYADQSVDCYLKQRGLRTITNEQFESVLMAISSLSDVLLSIVPCDANMVAEAATGGKQGLLNLIGEAPNLFDAVVEQEYDSAISEGPDSVSSSSSDGDDFFKL